MMVKSKAAITAAFISSLYATPGLLNADILNSVASDVAQSSRLSGSVDMNEALKSLVVNPGAEVAKEHGEAFAGIKAIELDDLALTNTKVESIAEFIALANERGYDVAVL